MQITAEDGREIPITTYHPAQAGTYPVIAFSHGAFAAPDRHNAMFAPLAAAGFVLISPMHVDSEELERETPPGREETWLTRNADHALSLSVPDAIRSRLADAGISVSTDQRISMGHSYGALIAQMAGGAMMIEPDGSQVSRLDPQVDAIVAWSPPGPVPTLVEAEGWSSTAVPSLTITGTTDVLPGFVDDWELRKASFEKAPQGGRALWVGEGIDHYFGGMFGREKPADENSQILFGRALAQTVGFMKRHIDAEEACDTGGMISGETYEAD